VGYVEAARRRVPLLLPNSRKLPILLEITLTPTADLTAELAVTISPADYQPGFEKRLKEASQKAQLKGFRPGKVPPALLRKMYGKSLLVEEVNKTLSDGVNQYIREQNLRLLGEPLPAADQETPNFDDPKDFSFKFEIGQLPEVVLPAVGALPVNRYLVTVDDETLADTLEQVKRQFGETIDPETAEATDYLTGELRQGETTFRTMLPLDKLKAGVEQFVGTKVDDVVTFDLNQAFANEAKTIATLTGLTRDEAAALSGDFEFAIEKITRTQALVMEQPLFDKVFGEGVVTSEEEFIAKVRATVQENYDREARKLFDNQVVDAVMQNTPLALPEQFFRRWLLVANEGKLTPQEVEENFEDFKREIRWSMVRNAVMEEQKIQITQKAVLDRATQNLMEQFGMSSAGDELREQVAKFTDQQLRQDNGKLYRDTFEAIVADEVVAHLRGVVVANESAITAEEFRTMSF
jgi:trigger factor